MNRRFPRPAGPYAVGTCSTMVTDPNRPVHMLSEHTGRTLFLKAWYPTTEAVGEPERLWGHLRQRTGLPFPMRLLLWRFRKHHASSHPAAPFHPSAPALPLVVYSHGMVSFAAENTSLAECLASHGYVVLAIDHQEQMAELQALQRSAPGGAALPPKALKRASPAERAAMGRAYFERATHTNRIVAERAADISHVLGRLDDIAIPCRNVSEQGLVLAGLSLGGAVATEFAATDKRTRAVVNMDGGMFGTHIGQPAQAPYLMLYASLTEGLNDDLLPPGAECHALAGTAHLNYHDIAMLMPELKLFGAVGKADARHCIELRNSLVLGFIEAHARTMKIGAA